MDNLLGRTGNERLQNLHFITEGFTDKEIVQKRDAEKSFDSTPWRGEERHQTAGSMEFSCSGHASSVAILICFGSRAVP